MISFTMANYNHGKYLKESLEAIFSQKCEKEVIVVDDKSTDNSLEILKRFQKKYSNLKILKNNKNLGPIHSCNRALEIAKGEFIIFTAADDIIQNIEKPLNFLKKNKNCKICVTNPAFFENKKPYIFKKENFLLKKPIILSPEKTKKLLFNTKFWIATHSSIYRKNSIKRWDPELMWLSDFYASYKTASKENILFYPETISAMRITKTSYSAKNSYLKKKKVFKYLLNKIKKDKLENFYKNSGILTHLGNFIFFVLIFSPKNYFYLKNFIIKKFKNVYRKFL